MSNGKRLITLLGAVLLLLSSAAPVLAQSGAIAPSPSTDVTARLTKLEQQIADAKSSADNAWMLTSSALVLMMTGPGLALFYGGLVRKKNVLGTMMQSFALMAVVTVLWALFSYSLSFGQGYSFIGGFQNLFLRGVGPAPDADYAATIPAQTFMVYQLMFAIITPGLIAGAFAERMKFSAMMRVHDPVVDHRLRSHGSHGMGQGRIAERFTGRTFPHAGFRRWDGGSHHVRSFRSGLRLVSGQASRISEGTHAAAQRGAQFHRSVPAVGGMVRFQRW